jgi:predicted aspartyl protease
VSCLRIFVYRCGMKKTELIAVLAALGIAAAPAIAETAWTPFKLREVSGIRPFVAVALNGVPFEFMIHANAGFFAMTGHANAASAGIGPIASTDPAYGITAPGQVSQMGKGTAILKMLKVGDNIMNDVPLKVFETPQEQKMDGMLGIGWLRANHAIVDFSDLRLGVPRSEADSASLNTTLLEHGYAAYPLTWNGAKTEYSLTAEVNGKPASFIVSTVSHLVIDDHLAKQAGIKLTEPVGTYGGPTGATGHQYANASEVALTIGGKRAAVPTASIYDIYTYDGEARPPEGEQIGGYLGAEFMLPNKAIIDFGNGTLYLEK